MDEQQQRQRRVNEAAEQYADAVRASFQALSEQMAEQQQRQAEATRTIAQETAGAYMEYLNSIFSSFAPGRVVQGWDESKHPRDARGRFESGEAWEESEHERDARGRFTR